MSRPATEIIWSRSGSKVRREGPRRQPRPFCSGLCNLHDLKQIEFLDPTALREQARATVGAKASGKAPREHQRLSTIRLACPLLTRWSNCCLQPNDLDFTRRPVLGRPGAWPRWVAARRRATPQHGRGPGTRCTSDLTLRPASRSCRPRRSSAPTESPSPRAGKAARSRSRSQCRSSASGAT